LTRSSATASRKRRRPKHRVCCAWQRHIRPFARCSTGSALSRCRHGMPPSCMTRRRAFRALSANRSRSSSRRCAAPAGAPWAGPTATNRTCRSSALTTPAW